MAPMYHCVFDRKLQGRQSWTMRGKETMTINVAGFSSLHSDLKTSHMIKEEDKNKQSAKVG